MILRRIPVLGLLVLVVMSMSPAFAGEGSWTYRGFTVSQVEGKADESLRRAVNEQIDIVSLVGLGPAAIEFFRSIPLIVVQAGTIARGTPGLYVRSVKMVKLTTKISTIGHKPVLLHELLHAYHDQQMGGGFGNADISRFYQDAKVKDLFEKRSHMMQNPSEFFACAGTTYLFGVTGQEPFRREKLEKQPELSVFFQKAFGPTSGAFEGSLSR